MKYNMKFFLLNIFALRVGGEASSVTTRQISIYFQVRTLWWIVRVLSFVYQKRTFSPSRFVCIEAVNHAITWCHDKIWSFSQLLLFSVFCLEWYIVSRLRFCMSENMKTHTKLMFFLTKVHYFSDDYMGF